MKKRSLRGTIEANTMMALVFVTTIHLVGPHAYAENLNVTVGTTTINSPSPEYTATYVGGSVDGGPTLELISPGTLTTEFLYLGFDGTGYLKMTGGNLNVTDFSDVGVHADGTATVSGGTWVTSGLYIGSSDVVGVVTIDSSGIVKVSGDLELAESFGKINLDAGGTLQIGNGGTTGTLSSYNTNDGTLTLSTLTNNGTLIFNRSDGYTYSGVLSGSGVVEKQGGGTLTLTGASTYTGGTTISAGTLSVGSGSTTGSIAGNVTNNSTLAFNRSDALTYAGIVSGTGAMTKSGAGTLSLTGEHFYTGGTMLTGGTLDLSGASGALTATSAVNINGGTLLLSGSAANRINDAATISLGAAGSTLQLSGAVTETLGALTLAGGAGARVIDFGATSGVLTFASLTADSSLPLHIWNWTGTTGTGGGTDRLFISDGFAPSNVSFFSGTGTGLYSGATVFTSSNELVPVPEASTLLGVLGLMAPLAWRERRHWMRCREARG
jgi:autotransporter-associated beta strand protein